MITILVTGGCGFLGSNLCRYLLKDPNNFVFCLDNNYTSSISNITGLFDNKNFKFIKHDIIEPITFLNGIKIDKIYNLACPASPPAYQKDSYYTSKISTIGTYNIIDLALKNGARLLFSSTSEIYGDPKEHPQKESYWGNVNPIGIRSIYDEGKRMSESILFAGYREKGLNMCIARIFNTYGPYMDKDDGRVVSNFVNQALVGDDITIYGSGSQTRSICYVDDLVVGLYKLMESSEIGPINLGNPSEFTVLELASMIKELTGSNSNIIFKELPLDDPLKRKPDISLAKEKLDWEPQVGPKDGLIRTIEYFKTIL